MLQKCAGFERRMSNHEAGETDNDAFFSLKVTMWKMTYVNWNIKFLQYLRKLANLINTLHYKEIITHKYDFKAWMNKLWSMNSARQVHGKHSHNGHKLKRVWICTEAHCYFAVSMFTDPDLNRDLRSYSN